MRCAVAFVFLTPLILLADGLCTNSSLEQFLDSGRPCQALSNFNVFEFQLTGYTNTFGVDAMVPTSVVQNDFVGFQGPWSGVGTVTLDADFTLPPLIVAGGVWSVNPWAQWQGTLHDPFTVVMSEQITGDANVTADRTITYDGGFGMNISNVVTTSLLNLPSGSLHVHWQGTFNESVVQPGDGFTEVGFIVFSPNNVPEPETLFLLAGPGAVLGWRLRLRRA